MPVNLQKYFHWLVVFNVSLGTLASTIDTSSVNVALPTIAAELGTGMDRVQWVISAYLLTISALVLVGGRLTDMLGRRFYCLGYLFFALGALLSSQAHDLPQLIIFRVIEGLGASIIMANSFSLVAWAAPPNQLGKLLGIVSTVAAIGTLTGPSLGGIMIGFFGWRANFYLGAGIGTLGLIQAIVLFWRTGLNQVRREKFDLLGAVLFAAAMVAILLGLDAMKTLAGRAQGWKMVLAAAVLLGTFAWRQARAAQPLLNLQLFRPPIFWTGLAARVLDFMNEFIMIFLMSFYLHDLKGLAPAQVGLVLTAYPGAVLMVTGLSGWLSDRYGARRLSVLGQVIGLVASIYLATMVVATTLTGIVLRIGLMGLGTGIFQSPNNSAVMEHAVQEHLGTTGSLLSLGRTIGQVLGVGLAVTMFTSLMSRLTAAGVEFIPAFSHSMQMVFWVGVGLRCLSLTLVLYGQQKVRIKHVRLRQL